MNGGIYVALSGARAQDEALDVAANNIANAQTPGFSPERVQFEQVLSRSGARDLTMVRTAGPGAVGPPGKIVSTGQPLDVAIQGEGYLSVTTPDGVRYTRAGALSVDSQGQLIGAGGHPMRGKDGGNIAVPPDATAVSVGKDGTVTGTVSGTHQTFGQLDVVKLPAESMRREGATLFGTTSKDPPVPASGAVLVEGALEQPNFDVVRGMVDLVKVSRNYETLHRAIETFKQVDERTSRGFANG